ncbi:hypothetical protein [Nonomuraea sp. NPDC049646]|uniref:hypothetical protein n=1 Tax=unclassified Nonomuraea TaxID=2593643 RepID=UPI0037901949
MEALGERRPDAFPHDLDLLQEPLVADHHVGAFADLQQEWAVGGRVVLGEGVAFQHRGELAPAVGEELGRAEQLAGARAGDGAEQGDVGVARADVAPEDGQGRVAQRLGDPAVEDVPVRGQHLGQPYADEVGPVPVGGRHGLGRLLHEVAPDAVVVVERVALLQADDRAEHVLGPVEAACLQQRDRVVGGGAGVVHAGAGRDRRVVSVAA